MDGEWSEARAERARIIGDLTGAAQVRSRVVRAGDRLSELLASVVRTGMEELTRERACCWTIGAGEQRVIATSREAARVLRSGSSATVGPGRIVTITRLERSGVHVQAEPPLGVIELRACEGGVFSFVSVMAAHVAHVACARTIWEDVSAGEGRPGSSGPAESDLLARLTPAQRAIVPYLLEGKTEEQIARILFRSRHTIHDHARAVYEALGVRNKLELLVLFHRVRAEVARV